VGAKVGIECSNTWLEPAHIVKNSIELIDGGVVLCSDIVVLFNTVDGAVDACSDTIGHAYCATELLQFSSSDGVLTTPEPLGRQLSN